MAKKKQQANWAGMLVGLCIGAVMGLWIVDYAYSFIGEDIGFGTLMMLMWGMLLWMYVCMFLHIILHEAGHLLAGLMSGYRFSLFRIASLMWVRRDGKIRFARYSLAGTGGQCLMEPPAWKDGKIPVVLYNLGGVLINVLTSLLCMVPVLLLPKGSLGYGLCVIAALSGFATALLNGLPLRMGMVDNDGRNTVSICRSPAAMRAFWVQMMVSHRIAQGDRLKEMPEKWFDCPIHDLSNTMITAVWVYRANRLLEEQELAQAEMAMDDLLRSEQLLGLYRAALTADKMFCMMLRGANRAEVDALYTKEQKRMMSAMGSNPSIIRTRYAYAMWTGDVKEAAKQRALFEKVAQKYPYPQEIEGERELLALLPVQV